MPSDRDRYLDADDVSAAQALRDDLFFAFKAAKGRYLDRGLSEEEARDQAEGYLRQRLNDVVLERGATFERVSLAELWAYAMRWELKVWAVLVPIVIAVLSVTFYLGSLF